METYIVAVAYCTESVRSGFTDKSVANLDVDLRAGQGVVSPFPTGFLPPVISSFFCLKKRDPTVTFRMENRFQERAKCRLHSR